MGCPRKVGVVQRGGMVLKGVNTIPEFGLWSFGSNIMRRECVEAAWNEWHQNMGFFNVTLATPQNRLVSPTENFRYKKLLHFWFIFVWNVKLYPKIAAKNFKSKKREKTDFWQFRFSCVESVAAMIFVPKISDRAWNFPNFTYIHVTFKWKLKNP